MIYIVTYDLVAPGQRYERLLELIKSEPGWARLGRSSFLVQSNETAVGLRDKLKRSLDGNDRLFVGVANAPAAWVGLPEEVGDWIKRTLEET